MMSHIGPEAAKAATKSFIINHECTRMHTNFLFFLNHKIHEKTRNCRSRRRLDAEDEVV